MTNYENINMHVFPKTFVVVMMHNCKAIYFEGCPFKTDHSLQTTQNGPRS